MGGIIPNKEDAITPGLLFAVSLPGGTSYDLSDPTTFGGLTERLGWRDQPNVVEFLKAQVKQFPEWVDAANGVFDGFRRGVPGGDNVPLPLAIIESLASQITGLPPGTWANVNEVVADLNSLPGVAQVIALLTNVPSVALTEASTVLGSYGSNLNAFLGATDFTSPTFNVATAATAFVNLVLAPLNLIPTLVGGLIPALNIPPLDASKIASGQFAAPQLQAVIDAVSQGFGGGTGLGFSGLKSLLNGLPSAQALTDAIGAGLGHLAGGYTPANITSFLGAIPGGNIGSVLSGSVIPGLDLSKIISGFGTGIATWLGGGGALPSATTLQGSQLLGSVASSLLSGTIGTSLIPGLDLSKITSGFGTGIASWLGAGGALPSTTTLGATGLTGLATSIGPWLTSGGALPSATTLQGSQLLGSVASSLLSGTLSPGIIPGLDLSKITSGLGTGIATWLGAGGALPSTTTLLGSQLLGTLGLGQIPQLPIAQILTLPGQLSTMFSPFNPPQTIGPGQITVAPQNLLKNWNFPDASSMAGETVWVWDAATQAAPGGSAKVNVATNTNAKALQSDPIQVVAKDTINASAWTQWSGLTYTGTPINLMLNLYDASNALLSQITLATATMTGATSSWVQLAGAYTIPDASTAAWARLVYNVSTTATVGNVWFTNGSFTKPNPIPQTAVQNLTGILGGADVGTTIQDFVDKGVQGIVNDFGTLTGQSLAAFNQQISNMARFLGFVTSGAAPANSVAQIASNVDNTVKARAVQKAFSDNIDPTTDAVFPLSQVWQNATLPTVAATAGATVMGDITIRDGGNKNAVTWYGYPTGGNFGSITDFRVNVYSIDKTTNVRTKVHGSINLIGSATPPGTGSTPVFNNYSLPASITNVPGDRLTAEIAILGSGTYNVVGQTISGQIQVHSVYGLHGLTRASAAAPTTMNPPGGSGSPLSYSRAIPWIGMSGVQSATQYTPVTIPYYGSDSFNPAIYQWANYMDIIVCGPGGRGADGSGYWGGNAGHPGGWGYYAGLPKSVWGAVTTSISITGGASQVASGVTVPGWGTIYGGAGANETSVQANSNLGYPGGGPGDVVVSGQFYPGGQGGATGQASGSTPGGAGAGGNAPFTVGSYVYGGQGGNGIAYLRLYQ